MEHPVTEEVTGLDLVREMFRIADGEELGYDDPAVRGHSFEFRINGEDPGRGFLPAPGTVTVFAPPTGPGVRLDAGVESGSVIGPAWDSLLAKLVVTGATREQALQRAARALAEFNVEGMATAIPFHRAVVVDPAFTSDPFRIHTRWIETEFVNEIKPFAAPAEAEADEDAGRETVVVEVGGKRLEVSLPSSLGMSLARTGLAAGAKPKRRAAKKAGFRGLRRHPRLPDAGHDREDRGGRGPGGQGGRSDRRPGSHEDGAAAQRAPRRRPSRAWPPRSAARSPPAPSSARSRTDPRDTCSTDAPLMS